MGPHDNVGEVVGWKGNITMQGNCENIMIKRWLYNINTLEPTIYNT